MPSYRVRIVVGLMRAGADPAAVLPTAIEAGRDLTAVEHGQIEIAAGRPRLTVRYEAPDDLTAAGFGRAIVERVDELVDVEVSRVTRRWGSRWYPLR
ncbi:hypothetical protein Q6348_02420 [Isoptericola sp. b441]|uniref:Uncharacterized protein n=1 Tax=Actinotalea lenta TaxID=3064654 RepID=A0ABT9DAS9_9CELL|nr:MULTISPECIES: hypothetical protein [unclassified Isoptericola]MDO8106047.1 hypothetical protein [Isoptericola sp. b441]MDO8122234.1 hypothetical protein [Isoptericola sp. b490]